MAEILPGKRCSSCGHLTHEYTEFACPNCGKSKIIRGKHCREISNTYKCEVCGFEGP
jgi:Zn-ribbon RNA-binding protein